MEDAQIIALFLQRDESAIAHTAEKYGPRLRRLALGILGDHSACEECENDAYLRAWNSIPPHDPGSGLYSFLACIVRNLAISRCRYDTALKRGACLTQLTDELEQCIPAPGDVPGEVDGKLLGEAVSAWLRPLPAWKRELFLRRYWYLDPIPTIAQRFSFSESKVKTTLFRLRLSLRRYLEKEGYDL